jgi:hypothetical protein
LILDKRKKHQLEEEAAAAAEVEANSDVEISVADKQEVISVKGVKDEEMIKELEIVKEVEEKIVKKENFASIDDSPSTILSESEDKIIPPSSECEVCVGSIKEEEEEIELEKKDTLLSSSSSLLSSVHFLNQSNTFSNLMRPIRSDELMSFFD